MVDINPLLSGSKLNVNQFNQISYSFAASIGIEIRNNVINILNNIIAPIINVNFVAAQPNQTGQIHYQFVNNPDPNYAASASGGVVSLDTDFDNNTDGFRAGIGTYGFFGLIHETLHALGLKHPGNYNNGGGGTPPPYLPYGEDNFTNTIMTYNTAGSYPSTPMPYDILALQQLYGARQYNLGNTTYRFDQVYGFSDGTRYWGSKTTQTKVTLWDFGISLGVDTLNFSALPFDGGGYHFEVYEGGILTTNSAFNATSYQALDDKKPGGATTEFYKTTTFGTLLAYNMRIENVFGSSSNDNIFGNDAANSFAGWIGNDFIGGWSGNDTLNGGDGNDTLYGDSGIDLIYGDSGNDLLFGHTDNQNVINILGIDNNSDSLYCGTGNDTAYGGNGNDFLDGWSENDKLYGEAGNDILDGDSGIDTLYGGDGNDLLFGNTNDQNVINVLGTDNNTDYLYGGAGNDTAYGGNGNDFLYGEANNDTLYGENGDDYLDGGTGGDYMNGGNGSDTFIVDSFGDVVVEGPLLINFITKEIIGGGGTDTVRYSGPVGYNLPDYVENLTLLGTANLSGRGNSLNNVLQGNNGNNVLFGLEGDDTLYGDLGDDILIGGLGNDFMDGGLGNDIYVVDSPGDVVRESKLLFPGTLFDIGGTDTVQSSIDYTLPDYIENLTLAIGTANLNGTGNNLNNSLLGNEGNNYLYGLDGNDTLDGSSGDDYLVGGDGNDSLSGGLGNDNLLGGNGNDSLSGGDGDDYLYGEAGNNIIDGGAGKDILLDEGSLNYTLTNTQLIGQGTDTFVNIETVYLYGDSNNNTFDTTGFTIGNVVFYGGAGNDLISAGSGNDILYGEADADTLNGGAGNDYILGGEGNDILNGGDGDDQFNGEAGNDIIDGGSGNDALSINGDLNYKLTNTQFIGEGTDTLVSIEGAFLLGGSGSSTFDATGFTTGNVSLFGGAGNDLLSGGAKDDLLYGEADADTLSGGAGNDYMIGGEGNDSLIGGLNNDQLVGDIGNDTLLGGQGVDNLEGGDGSDVFRFTAPTEGIDLITDFASGIDKIWINKAGFGGGLVAGLLSNSQFVLGTTASDGTDRFIYDQGTGALFFDKDGTGVTAQVQLANLSNFSALSASDILVV